MARAVKAKPGPTAIYLYCVSKGPVVSRSKIRGVSAGFLVEALRCGNLICWAGRVPRAEFTEELSKNMENLDWLAAASTRHQEVVAEIARGRDTLPARFGAVFLTEESLYEDVRQRSAMLEADFLRIRNCDEWGVKVFAEARKVAIRTGKAGKAMSGKEYLRAKSELLPRRASGERDGEIERFAAAIEQIAKEAAEGGRISGGQRGLLFQGSFLIERSRRGSLEAIVRRFSKAWSGSRRIELTGPWPPYSFVSRGGA